MLRRRALLASAAALAAPALIPRASLGQALRKVKLGSAFTTTTNAMFLMPDLLRPEGIDAEVITFPSLVQRMQAVASGSVDVGNGGLSATMQVTAKGLPMSVLANGCDGGWMMLARPGITGFQQLRHYAAAAPHENARPELLGSPSAPNAVLRRDRALGVAAA